VTRIEILRSALDVG